MYPGIQSHLHTHPANSGWSTVKVQEIYFSYCWGVCRLYWAISLSGVVEVKACMYFSYLCECTILGLLLLYTDTLRENKPNCK